MTTSGPTSRDRPPRGGRGGILSGPIDGPARLAAELPTLAATEGTIVLHRGSGFAGTLAAFTGEDVVLRGHTGLERRFRNTPGSFAVVGQVVHLVAPRAADAVLGHLARAWVSTSRKTNSGSRAVIGATARVARASRILVEGVHDAELVERVWGDDLRVEGVVVERLDGADHLAEVVAGLAPGRGRRLGILLDHLVAGSKEARLAAAVRHPHVLVTGTPYVDVWEAVRPAVVGIDRWPDVPRGTPWKEGAAAALGTTDPREAWRRVLGSVQSWKDLETPFVGAVERLIDFVTEPS